MIARTITTPTAFSGADGPRQRQVRRGRGRLRAAVEQFPPETIEAIAQRVAELLRQPHPPTSGRGLVTAEQLASQLGLSRAWVYEHAQELGAIRLGAGPKARLRFNPTTAAEALANRDDRDAPPAPRTAPVGRRGRPRSQPAAGTTLLPIRGQRAIARVPVVASRRRKHQGLV